MVTKGSVAKGLAIGVGLLVGSLAGPGEGWAQVGASRGMPAPSGTVQPRGQVTVPGYRAPEQRHQVYDHDGDRHRDRDRDRDRDRHSSWDHHYSHRPHWGYSSGHSPHYGYYYPGPDGSYPGRWVWDGRNWLFVPIY
jgi:hypothetical protein